MYHLSRSIRPVLSILAASIITIGSEAAGQAVIVKGQDRIAIHAENMTLAALFEELSNRISIELLQVSPETRSVRVSVQAEDVSPTEGIVKVLEEAKVDFALSGGYGRPFRILIGSAESNAGRSGSSAPPLLPEQLEPDMRPGRVGVPPRTDSVGVGGAASRQVPSPQPRDRSVTSTSGQREDRVEASGGASFVSGSASLTGPLPRGIAPTGALLAFGLLLGLVLIRGPHE